MVGIHTDVYLWVYKNKSRDPNAKYYIITRTVNSLLSPSRMLLNIYKNGFISWEKYKELLVKELLENPRAVQKMREIKKEALTKDVYLVCYEKDASQCHRSIVKDLIENTIKIEEDMNHKLEEY